MLKKVYAGKLTSPERAVSEVRSGSAMHSTCRACCARRRTRSNRGGASRRRSRHTARRAPTLFCIPGAGASVTTRNPLADRAIGMPITCPPA